MNSNSIFGRKNSIKNNICLLAICDIVSDQWWFLYLVWCAWALRWFPNASSTLLIHRFLWIFRLRLGIQESITEHCSIGESPPWLLRISSMYQYFRCHSHWIRLAAPDFPLFKNYKRFMKRRPNARLYLVDPRSIWSLWRSMVAYTGVNIRPNPPSSGFIGLALLLPHCSYVDIVEYMPSTRLSGRCHYYDREVNNELTKLYWVISFHLCVVSLLTYFR